MARCPLCSERSAKRYCPAKLTSICPVCCGTKREVEIDCPSTCTYLQTGRSYKAESKPLDPSLAARARSLRDSFADEYGPILQQLSIAVAEARRESPWMVDQDVEDVYETLKATMKTLSSGIYYETLPEGPAKIALFRKMKDIFDALMTSSQATRRVLKIGEVNEILDFLLLSVQVQSNGRPRSRKYLDWICAMSGLDFPARESSRLIIP